MAKKFTYLFVFSTVVLLWMCGSSQQSAEEADQSISLEEQKTVYPELTAEERKLKLAECASCHPQEHHNEMIGPHSQSYAKLLEHLAMADTSRFFPRPYHKFVTEATEQACVNCHSAKNLFETNYRGLESLTDISRFTKEFYPEAWDLPEPRPKGISRMTGIDCLTCHQKGDRMVTTADFVRNQELKAPCDPIASKFFSSNNNCIACHKITNEGMADNVNNPRLVKTMSCNGCHMEKDADQKFTHYYFWRHDSEDKQQYPMLKLAFEDIQLIKLKDREAIKFVWNNASAPHRFSECAELFVHLDFYDSSGKLCAEFIKRLNNKISHDNTLRSFFGEERIWGEVGFTFLPTEANCSDTILLQDSDIDYVEISGYEKPQYWISDVLAKKIYKKTRKL